MLSVLQGYKTLRPIPVLVVLGLCLFPACSPFPKNKLEAVKRAGELVVLTRNSPTTYYEGPDGPVGIEYEMAKAFADRLGVRLRLVAPNRFNAIIPMITRGQGDLAAAGLSITEARRELVRFAPAYQEIRQQLVYHRNANAPSKIEDLKGRNLLVVAGTSYVERLNQLRLLHPGLRWSVTDKLETEELLQQIQGGQLDLTIADSNILASSLPFNTDLRVAFTIREPEQLAWAFPKDADDSLYQEAVTFFKELHASGDLDHLLERYYGATNRFNPINIDVYVQRIQDTLRTYRPLFEAAGKETDLDWRLLAALAYQESFWTPTAVSYTGVRGMMMLTRATADHMGVTNREDPWQSILGGTRYLYRIMQRLPKGIQEPDRTWFALAAYNVGLSHLEDARIITQSQGADPNKWSDVKDRLPLLAKYAWHSKTKYGYARGYEPVQFVNRIRIYYEVLKKAEEKQAQDDTLDALKLKTPAL